MAEEEIAALDGNWAEFSPAQRAAFTLARKLSYEPHNIRDTDIDLLRKYYTDLQILEMVLSIAGNNAINRWKEGAGIPQEKESSAFLRKAEKPLPANRLLPIETYLTPTPERYQNEITRVAPLLKAPRVNGPSRLAVCRRAPLESRAEVEKFLEACRKRVPRLPLVEEAKAQAIVPADWPPGPLPQWLRLLANFPRDGKARIANLRADEDQGDLEPLFKAQVSWIIARQDRAWYATGRAKLRLQDLGWSDEQIYQLDGDWRQFTPAERALFRLARQLAAAPIVLTDEDVAKALQETGPRVVVQLINYTSGKALFDRVTEAAGLRLEGSRGRPTRIVP